jgi:hypothetical protein
MASKCPATSAGPRVRAGFIETLAEDVVAGRVDRGDAAVVGQLYNTLIRAVSTEMKVREVTELTQRLEELKAVTEQNTQRGRGRG